MAETIKSEQAAGVLTFARDNAFQKELRSRVDEYFRVSGRRQRDCPEMYLKTAVILGFFAGCYSLLVFVAQTWWQAVPVALLTGLAMAVIGFNIEHDGGHRSYSDHELSLIHISEPTRLLSISYAVFCLK